MPPLALSLTVGPWTLSVDLSRSGDPSEWVQVSQGPSLLVEAPEGSEDGEEYAKITWGFSG